MGLAAHVHYQITESSYLCMDLVVLCILERRSWLKFYSHSMLIMHRYMRTYLAGVKALLLKTAVIDNSDHDFRPIPQCDPPFKLPASVERRPSTFLRLDDVSDAPSHSVARRTSSAISAAAFSELGHHISLHSPLAEEGISENDAGISDDECSDTDLDDIDVSSGRIRQSETAMLTKKEV